MDDEDLRPSRVGSDTIVQMMRIQAEQIAHMSDILHRLTEQVAVNTKAIASLRAAVENLRERRERH